MSFPLKQFCSYVIYIANIHICMLIAVNETQEPARLTLLNSQLLSLTAFLISFQKQCSGWINLGNPPAGTLVQGQTRVARNSGIDSCLLWNIEENFIENLKACWCKPRRCSICHYYALAGTRAVIHMWAFLFYIVSNTSYWSKTTFLDILNWDMEHQTFQKCSRIRPQERE